MTELEIAEKMASGELPSPQQIGTFHLFDLRISGVGAAYRAGLAEYVWRSKEDYLNPTMLRRCNGLPVIWVHPEKVNKLNSEEWGRRAIGAIMLPFVRADELRGIARVYDDEAIKEMTHKQYSTSPGVVFAPGDGNQSFELPNGETLLIEGVPSLLDHLAVVTRGVWDKTDDPSGVLTSALSKESTMTDQEKADAARADAAKKLEEIKDAMGKISSRLDSYDAERARKDAEEKTEKERLEREDKARKDKARRDAARKDRFAARKDGETDDDRNKRFDADEKAEIMDAMEEGCDETTAMDRAKRARKDAETAEEAAALKKAEEARADAARRDAAALATENAALKARLEAVEAFMGDARRETTAADRDAMAASQARADGVMAMFGERAPVPMAGEAPLAYRRRVLDKLKVHSPQFKDVRFDAVDEALLRPAEEIVYNDAQIAARSPAKVGPGLLAPITRQDSTGRTITEFTGDPMAWMGLFMTDGHRANIIRNPNAGV